MSGTNSDVNFQVWEPIRMQPYDGPFNVKSIKNVNVYELVHPDDDTPQGTHNVSQLKPYIPPVIPNA